jgi:hypothetical protein
VGFTEIWLALSSASWGHSLLAVAVVKNLLNAKSKQA